jgi:hypothetical protein
MQTSPDTFKVHTVCVCPLAFASFVHVCLRFCSVRLFIHWHSQTASRIFAGANYSPARRWTTGYPLNTPGRSRIYGVQHARAAPSPCYFLVINPIYCLAFVCLCMSFSLELRCDEAKICLMDQQSVICPEWETVRPRGQWARERPALVMMILRQYG